jgi:peptide/nickel transport system substrate-binding protein
MDRRGFLKAAAATGAAPLGVAGLPAPALSQGAAARTLRFVPQANLANFDPIWGTQYVVRNASAMVWDLLYGVDDKLEPRPQMVEAEARSRRRPHLDLPAPRGPALPRNEPVLAEGTSWPLHALDAARLDGPMLAGSAERAGSRWTTAPSAGR